MEVISQFISLCLDFCQLISKLLNFADLGIEGREGVISFSLGLSGKFELFSPDIFLDESTDTFLLMRSSIRWLFFFSLSLKTLISGFGMRSPFLGRGGITVFSSIRSALYSCSFSRLGLCFFSCSFLLVSGWRWAYCPDDEVTVLSWPLLLLPSNKRIYIQRGSNYIWYPNNLKYVPFMIASDLHSLFCFMNCCRSFRGAINWHFKVYSCILEDS